jgi:hypothetical protein
MDLFNRLANWFSRQGRDENQLNVALDFARHGLPAEAIAIYNELLLASATSATTKARALFNRALAYSALKEDSRAITDLKQLASQVDIPENVRSAARTQLVRLNNRQKES